MFLFTDVKFYKQNPFLLFFTETKDTVKSSSDGETQYLAGYSKCLAEISTFLEQTRTSESSLQEEIINHVTGKIKNQLSSVCFPGNKDCESSESTSEAKPKKSNLVKIKPAVTSPNDVISNDLPIDLRTKVTDQCDTNKSSTPCLYEQSKGPVLQATYSSSSQIPVGGVGGGQILLLVQLPQSVTSQVTPSLAHQQLACTPLLNQTLSTETKQQTFTSSSITPGILKLETSPSGYVALPANNSLSAHAQTNSAGTSAGLGVLNLVLPSDNSENSKIGQGDHWRPW